MALPSKWATEPRLDEVGGECIGCAHEDEETRNKRVCVAEPLRMLDGQPKQQPSVSRWGRRVGIHPPTEVTVAEVAEAWRRWEGGQCDADLKAHAREDGLTTPSPTGIPLPDRNRSHSGSAALLKDLLR